MKEGKSGKRMNGMDLSCLRLGVGRSTGATKTVVRNPGDEESDQERSKKQDIICFGR